MTEPHPTPNRIRTSDEERERLATILRAAAAKGMLTLEEVDERLATGYAARYRDELWPLLADLPDGGRGLAPPLAGPAWPGTGTGRHRHGRLDRALALHAGSIAVLGLALAGIWALTGGGFFWPAWPLAILAFSLLHRAKRRAYRRWWAESTQAGQWGPENGPEQGTQQAPWGRGYPGIGHCGYRVRGV